MRGGFCSEFGPSEVVRLDVAVIAAPYVKLELFVDGFTTFVDSRMKNSLALGVASFLHVPPFAILVLSHSQMQRSLQDSMVVALVYATDEAQARSVHRRLLAENIGALVANAEGWKTVSVTSFNATLIGIDGNDYGEINQGGAYQCYNDSVSVASASMSFGDWSDSFLATESENDWMM